MGAVGLVLDRLVSDGFVPPGSLRGCSPAEIEEIQADQRVTRLPAGYVCYLRRMGHGAGPFLRGTDAFLPRIIGLKNDATDLFAEWGLGVKLGSETFVFAMHQGYQVFWFSSVASDDPEVMMFQEGDQAPHREWDSYSSFLSDMIREIDRR